MQEEDKDMNLDQEIESKDNNEDINPVEQEARGMGWRPLEEWKGPKEKWRSATEFVDRASFFKKIEAQNQVISELNKTLKVLADQHSKVAKTEREKVLKELNEQKKLAFQDQDFDKLSEIDDQIVAIKSAPDPEIKVPDVAPPQNQAEANAQLEAFKARNPWYETDQELTELAETLAGGYLVRQQQKNKPVNPEELFAYIEKHIEKRLPKQEDEEPSKKKRDPVMSSDNNKKTTPSKGRSKYTVADLTPEQKAMGRRFVELKAVDSMQEYVDQLAELGDIQ